MFAPKIYVNIIYHENLYFNRNKKIVANATKKEINLIYNCLKTQEEKNKVKVIKRDGRAVDYDKSKIMTAIEKANQEVQIKQRASKDEIKEITEYIESLGKKRMLVEDIQDIIEEKLMELDKYELAKKYIVYRYTRALVRKSNTTDESILGLIRNQNLDLSEKTSGRRTILASTQRDFIAGEVSKDLTKRLLLPEKISKAHSEGAIYFHDAQYFVQPIFNSCLVNIGDMLDNGTVMSGNLMESPKTFQVACILTAQIISVIASNQYGGQSVDLSHLGKYLRKSYNKLKEELQSKYKEIVSQDVIEDLIKNMLKTELRQGIQTIQYQINTLMTLNTQAPVVTLFLNLKIDDEYIEENAMIIEEVLKQRCQGVKNESGEYISPKYPKLIYVLDEHNCLKGGKYDYLTKLAIKCSQKRTYPEYISAKKMREYYQKNVFCPIGNKGFLSPFKDKDGKYKFEGRFNQGVVSINLPQIAIISDGDEKTFWNLLDEKLEICKEALMCRHFALIGTLSDISPTHWKYGAIARFEKEEKIDKLLYDGYSTLSLGYVGINEMTKIMKGENHFQNEAHDFAIKVMKHLNEAIENWSDETNISFVLCESPDEKVCYKFAQIDRQRFGTIKGINDKEKYTNAYHIEENNDIDIFQRLSLEDEFQKLSLGGGMSEIKIKEDEDIAQIENVIRFIYDNVTYARIDN